MPRSALLNVMVSAAEKAGRNLTRDFGEVENLQVSRKGPADFVSKADVRAEEIVHAELMKARPGYGFLGEEGRSETGDGQHRWIVDPLDGTTNFLHGIPHFAVSIALERQGELVAGVVFNPISDELFVAERGNGAFVNDRRMRVAGRTDLSKALFATGLPFMGHGDVVQTLAEIRPLFSQTSGLRRFGAASLDLAWTAVGRFDGFWEHDIQPWDMAAGIVLVREAGGFVTDAEGGPRPMAAGSIAAGNETMHRALVKNVKDAKRGAAAPA